MGLLADFKRALERRPPPTEHDVRDPAIAAWLADLELRLRAVETVLYAMPDEPPPEYPDATVVTIDVGGAIQIPDVAAFPPGYLWVSGNSMVLNLKSDTEPRVRSHVIIETEPRRAKMWRELREQEFTGVGQFVARHVGDGLYEIRTEIA